MFLKLATVIAALLLIGAGMLGMRQHRLNLMNQMTTLHSELNRDRQSIWTDQARIAEHMDPQQLSEAIEAARLQLKPVEAEQPELPQLVHEADRRGSPPSRMIQYHGGG